MQTTTYEPLVAEDFRCSDRHSTSVCRAAAITLFLGALVLASPRANAAVIEAPVLSAPSTSTGTYSLSWTGGGGVAEDRYTLEESVDGGGVWSLIAYRQPITSKTLTKLTSGQRAYRVQHCLVWSNENVQCSGYSATRVVKVFIQPSGIPTIGCSGCNSPEQDGELTITWTRPAGTVTHYRVFRRHNGGSWNRIDVANPSATQQFFGGLGDGVWDFQVDACNTLINTNCSSDDSAIKRVHVRPTARPTCSASKIANEILAPPTSMDPNHSGSWATIDCSVKLPPGQSITRLVKFVGPNSSYTTFDCNGSTIEPLAGLASAADAIWVASRRITEGNGAFIYDPARNITIKNCKVKGSVRIATSKYRPNGSVQSYKNSRGPEFVEELRQTSPTGISFENLEITNTQRTDAVYFEQGVTLSKLVNSKVVHNANGLALYISAESGFNTIDNNEFHSNSLNGRELMAIDGSENNVVTRNWFSGLRNGGIYLYRNCGEAGAIRYAGAMRNVISDNIFYYSDSDSPDYAIYVGSRNGEGTGSYTCAADAGHLWTVQSVRPAWRWDSDWESSSTVNYDYARHNLIFDNRVCNDDPADVIRVRNATFNHSNVVSGNTKIVCEGATPIPR